MIMRPRPRILSSLFLSRRPSPFLPLASHCARFFASVGHTDDADVDMEQGGPAGVSKIVFTGGPCGGKSTALSLLTERLSGYGLRVFSVPEAATLLITGGLSFASLSRSQIINAQVQLMKTQMALEDAMSSIARDCGQPAVVLCDRGALDCKAYMDEDMWQEVLEQGAWTELELRDRRYDGIVHLVTAAIGAESFYTTQNNAARTETLEEAAAVDRRIRAAWEGAHRLRVIDNRDGFTEKMDQTMRQICRVVGVPAPIKKRFFVCELASAWPDDAVPGQTFELEYTYLEAKHGDHHRRVQRRLAVGLGVGGGAGAADDVSVLDLSHPLSEEWVRRTTAPVATYSYRVRRIDEDGQSTATETFRQIDGRTFEALRAKRKYGASVAPRGRRRRHRAWCDSSSCAALTRHWLACCCCCCLLDLPPCLPPSPPTFPPHCPWHKTATVIGSKGASAS